MPQGKTIQRTSRNSFPRVAVSAFLFACNWGLNYIQLNAYLTFSGKVERINMFGNNVDIAQLCSFLFAPPNRKEPKEKARRLKLSERCASRC